MTQISSLSKELLLGGLLYFKSCRERYLQAIKGSTATLLDPDDMTAYAIVERSIRLFISVDLEVRSAVLMRRLIDDSKKLPPANSKLIADYFNIISKLDDYEQFTEQ